MSESRRDLLKRVGQFAIGAAGLVAGAKVVEAEAKPVTKAGLGRSLLSLADKAEKAGFKVEANEILRAALKVIDSPVGGK